MGPSVLKPRRPQAKQKVLVTMVENFKPLCKTKMKNFSLCTYYLCADCLEHACVCDVTDYREINLLANSL